MVWHMHHSIPKDDGQVPEVKQRLHSDAARARAVLSIGFYRHRQTVPAAKMTHVRVDLDGWAGFSWEGASTAISVREINTCITTGG
mmetsp:Transcript_69629/g.137806  ORF Transcript_69629/g.137806 Transcript_69629/m.137806 type:complete len:86 (-) Transcript_69629:101-358(-)